MNTILTITDVTRMNEGRVCIAGYDEEGNCIRPVLPFPGIHESMLYSQGYLVIYPFARVQFHLLDHIPDPPHTEDYRFNPNQTRFLGSLDPAERQEFLESTVCASVKDIFGAEIHGEHGFFVIRSQGSLSLGTICPAKIFYFVYQDDPERGWKYRIGFSDHGKRTYHLTVTDLTWRYYCDHHRRNGRDPEDISLRATSALKSKRVYLRIGLARGWAKFPERCYLQVTGTHTFPNYLSGRSPSKFYPPVQQ